MKGIYIFGPESDRFLTCESPVEYGLYGTESVMKPVQDLAYQLVDRHKRLYVPVSLEIEVGLEEPCNGQCMGDVEVYLEVIRILHVEDHVPADCAQHFDFPNRLPSEKEN